MALPRQEVSLEDASRDRSAILHSLFDLADGVAETDFAHALEAFFQHLKERGFAKSLRFMRRKLLPEFAARLPEFAYYAAIEFHDLDREQRATTMSPRTPNRSVCCTTR
jgi:Family of unknown function (DUF6614)